jgi:hypothetical protein
MTRRLWIALAVGLLACDEDSQWDDWVSWEEITDAGAEITWQGTVYDGPYTGENDVLTGGNFVVEDFSGEVLAEGEEPYTSSPGYWKVKVPPSTDVVLRLSGEGLYSTLWQTRTPARSAYWYSGGLFVYDQEDWSTFFLEVEPDLDTDLDAGTCWVWGSSWDPSEWIGAQVTISSSSTDGKKSIIETTPSLFSLSEEGAMTAADSDDEVTYFFAFDVPAGDVTISIAVPDGRSLSLSYPSCDGEVVSAWWLVLPTAP